jgi:hypothetical protein
MLDGVVEHWIEIDIQRPTGAGAEEVADGDEPVEPRLVTITGHGARWRDLRLD